MDLAFSAGGSTSISQILSNSGFTNPLPPGCNLDNVYKEICSADGITGALACKDQFAITDFPKSEGLTASVYVLAIEAYTALIDQYTECWEPGGSLRPAVACVDPTIFQTLKDTIAVVDTTIDVEITTVQDEIESNSGDLDELDQKLSALKLAATSVTAAEALTVSLLAGDDPSDSTNSGGGSSGENSGGDGGGEVDAGVVAGAVVGGIAGVGLVVYVLDKTNVITLPPFPAATGANVNVASAFYSEEASAFI
ncbi:MAG: hypothetical protein ACPH2J_08290 [Akkermansiaceae bacterium]